jgi:hypothetical protein
MSKDDDFMPDLDRIDRMTEDELVSERKRCESYLSGYRSSHTVAMSWVLVGAAFAVVTGNAVWFALSAIIGVLLIFTHSVFFERGGMRYLKYLRRVERSLHAILVGKADRVSTQPTSPTARKGPNVSGMA